MAPPGAACLLLAAAIHEWPRLLSRGDLYKVSESPVYFAIAALVGFAVNFIGFLVVQATSTLTMKILSVVRCIGLVVVGVLVYRETCTMQQSIGYTVALVGFTGYNYVQLFPESVASSEEMTSRRNVSAATSYGAEDPWEAHPLKEYPQRMQAKSSQAAEEVPL